MGTTRAVSTGHLEPAYKRWLRSWSWPQVKRAQRPIEGGEVELLQQLGELRRTPSDPGLPTDRSLARWRWM